MNLLQHIQSPADIRNFSYTQLCELATEIREQIIDIVSVKEGHLGASLGVVELTIALHYFFDTPNDLLVWDVGHQAYPHKLLTGRKLDNLRQKGGVSGFPVRSESVYDSFGTGHSSTSISAVLGMALASQLKHEKRQHIAVIGDASIASGMAFEALNHAGVSDTNILIILNDNQIGIDPSVGALKSYLANLSEGNNQQNVQNLFEKLHFHYHGPVDGHDISALLDAFKTLQNIEGPKFLHILTQKGKGYAQAEEEQTIWHAPGRFDKSTGERLNNQNTDNLPKFQEIFGKTMCELAAMNPAIYGITPAMPTGSSLKYMMEEFPERAIDVGIAEQHAVTLAAGLATQGIIPYITIYSTFLQRAYDQVIHDVALQNLPVVFCVDRAGIVCEDGATHHGYFDIAFMNAIPNMIVTAPLDEIEFRNLLYTTQFTQQPFSIRYPRGKVFHQNIPKDFKSIGYQDVQWLRKGEKLCVISTGTIGMQLTTIQANFTHIHFPFVKPLNTEVLDTIFKEYTYILTIEEGITTGGFGNSVLQYSQKQNYTGFIETIGLPDEFITHGNTQCLLDELGLSSQKLETKIVEILSRI